MTVHVKICGLSSAEGIQATAAAGATYMGFVFYPPSPRAVTPDQAARLAGFVPPSITKVALLVDAPDRLISEVISAVNPDLLQLHGKETPARVAEIKRRFGCAVMKAVAIGDADDVAQAGIYETIADLLLFDAKPPKSMANALPGGNALAFDWALIASRKTAIPWMLSGGLTPDNVAKAIRVTGARMVDVSSGVEDAPGVKNPALIKAFVKAAQSAS